MGSEFDRWSSIHSPFLCEITRNDETCRWFSWLLMTPWNWGSSHPPFSDAKPVETVVTYNTNHCKPWDHHKTPPEKRKTPLDIVGPFLDVCWTMLLPIRNFRNWWDSPGGPPVSSMRAGVGSTVTLQLGGESCDLWRAQGVPNPCTDGTGNISNHLVNI